MAEFTYNASALGAGGIIRHRNVETYIPSIGSVALSPTGGAGRTVVENYYSEPLSFDFAETRVSGGKVDGKHTTQTYVYMKNLQVFNKVTIGELRGIVTSTQSSIPHDDDNSIVMEIYYHDVWVAGQEVSPDVDVCVKSLKRYNDLAAVLSAVEGNEGPLPTGVVLPDNPEADLPPQFTMSTLAQLKEHVTVRRALRGSLVRKVYEDVVPGQRPFDVPVVGLGTVRFGELMFKPGRRRVNLLRVALGADTFEEDTNNESIVGPNGGSLTIASVEGNGTPVYP
ncbi:MAG TPA: hypothetical protein VEO54_04955 [Thermoanaerobaculia bacterium]|nr:hypothetical protein [Thermoanaerobaculia bacterium]